MSGDGTEGTDDKTVPSGAAWLSESPLFRHLGFSLLSNGDGHAVVRCAVMPEVTNRKGDLHGGTLATLLDTTISHAVRSAATDLIGASTIHLSISYLLPARGDVECIGECARVGGTIGFGMGRVIDSMGACVATAQASFRLIYKPRERKA